MPPDFSFEHELGGLICGVDEAGRGPLAGPVVAGAVILPADLPNDLLEQLDDSKALSAAKRERLFERLQALVQGGVAHIGVGLAEVEEIDRVNILQATFLAMRRAVDGLGMLPDWALVDGNQKPPLPCAVRCVVKGDSRSLSIAAASIIAKVTRDRIMEQLAEAHPGYGWERNAGYGTAAHLAALQSLGATPHHRRSFAPVTKILMNR